MNIRKIKKTTKKQAIALYESRFWETMSYEERAKFQLVYDRICMPFDIFSEAMSKTLKRSVYTHEFTESNREKLMAEIFKGEQVPTTSELLCLISTKIVK
jgi:hypothetical protein